MSFTIHLLTRQPFPPGLRLSATWDDPAHPIAGGRGYGVAVGLSNEPVRELSMAKLRSALGRKGREVGDAKPPRSRASAARSSAGNLWLPQSRVFVHKGSDTAFSVGKALVDALGGVMVLEGWIDDYESTDSIFYVSENLPPVAPSKDELRAIFKRAIAEAKRAAKADAEERRRRQQEDDRQKRQHVAAGLAATLEKAAAGEGDPPPAVVLGNDNDRALHEAVRGFLNKGELPVLLGLASQMEYGVQRGLAGCLTTARFFVVPVDVPLSPSHRFARPVAVKVKPAVKPVYDVRRSDLRAVRMNTVFPDLLELTPRFSLCMEDTSPHPLQSDQTEPLSNQRAFRKHLPLELVHGGATWTIDGA